MSNSLENYLEAADGAGKILAHAKLLIKMAHLYQEIAPTHLCQASHLANYKSGILVIHATNGSVAAKLRQLATTLADGFSERGIECNGVQIKVQARNPVTQSRTSTQKPLSVKTFNTLLGLRETLPDSPLRAALESLLDRSAKQE